MPETLVDHIGADGTFTDGFAPAVKTALGPEYAESKYFDDIHDLTALAKRGMDTRVDNTKFREQLKTAIIRPGETATDDDKATFRTSLQAELGAGKTVEDYAFPKPDNIPEGMPYNEDAAKEWGAVFHKLQMPVEVARELQNLVEQKAISEHLTKQVDDKKAFDTEVAAIHKDRQPDDVKVMGRHVMTLINQYPKRFGDMTGADGAAVKGLISRMTEGKIGDSPDDLAKWNGLGVSPKQFTFMAELGKDMSAGGQRGGSGGAGGGTDAEKGLASLQNAVCAETPAQQVPVGGVV